MTITKQQLAYAAKALGVDSINVDFDKRGVHLAFLLTEGESPEDETEVLFGPGFAEWSVPLLEERHDVAIKIFRVTKGDPLNPWIVDDIYRGGLASEGPDIDTAVLLFAAMTGERMK